VVGDESGQALAEYGLLTAMFAILMIVAMLAVGTASGSKLSGTQCNLSSEYLNE